MTQQKLEMNLTEESEIGFKLKIEGSDAELSSNKPKIRFAITESKTGKGWIFNAEKSLSNDGVTITIPSMKGIVSEGADYKGKLEVILGNKYFTPTEVDIMFIDPVKVEASIVKNTTKQTKQLKEEVATNSEISISSILEEIISKPVSKSKISYDDFSETEKAAVNKLFVEKCQKLGIPDPTKYLKNGSANTKNKLKALLAESAKEFLAQ